MTALATALDERLDALTEQLAALTAEVERLRTERERKSELLTDLTSIADQALPGLAVELERAGLTSDDLVDLLRALAAAVPDLHAAIEQLSSLAELARTAGPIAEPALDSLTERLAELERRGYFDFVRSAGGVVDNVVTSFTPGDVEALGDNIVLILNTIKEMTRPEVMQMLQRTMHTVQVAEPAEPPSLLALLKEMRQPEVRLGLYRVFTALRSMGTDPDSSNPEPTEKGAT